MGKRFLYGALVLTFGIWVCNYSSVSASNIEYSNNDSGIEIDNGTGGVSGTGEETGAPDSESGGLEGEQNTELLDDGVPEILGEEVVKVQNKTFVLLDHIENGLATQTDIYNVLVSIHNLGLLSFIVALMLWTYKIITSSFRRFIG